MLIAVSVCLLMNIHYALLFNCLLLIFHCTRIYHYILTHAAQPNSTDVDHTHSV